MEEVKALDFFNREHFLAQFQSRFSRKVRRRMYEHWFREAGTVKGLRVLDVGATPDFSLPDSNCWVPWFLESGVELHLDSPENIYHLEKEFPGVKVATSGRAFDRIPLEDRSYEWAVSSATFEHVGGLLEQIGFIKELGRVADAFFLTTPNRFHWLEFHTKLPFLHWLPRSQHQKLLRALGNERWADESLLRLVGRAELLAIAREAVGSDWDLQVDAVWALGMPSNLMLLGRRICKNR